MQLGVGATIGIALGTVAAFGIILFIFVRFCLRPTTPKSPTTTSTAGHLSHPNNIGEPVQHKYPNRSVCNSSFSYKDTSSKAVTTISTVEDLYKEKSELHPAYMSKCADGDMLTGVPSDPSPAISMAHYHRFTDSDEVDIVLPSHNI